MSRRFAGTVVNDSVELRSAIYRNRFFQKVSAMDMLARDFQSLTREAERLAGGLRDLAQRATVYHHLFRASGGNHAFPLIAAHGALWAGGYFRFGNRLAESLSWQYAWSPALRRQQLQRLEAFADAFRDINRRVCVDTYVSFHFTARYGEDERVVQYVSPELLSVLRVVHAARRAGKELPDNQKQEVFLAHFLDEQQRVVGPAIEKAVAEFDWPLVRFIALKPWVRFAYFPGGQRFWFANFADRQERIAKGMQAFETAASVGWRRVEQALRHYDVLPLKFFADPIQYFADFKTAFLAAT